MPTEGPPVWGGPVFEINDEPGHEDPDSLTRCLLDNAYEVLVESDKLNLHIIHRIRSFPSDQCHSNGLQAIKKSITCRIYSVDWILLDMWDRTFYVMHRQEASLVVIFFLPIFSALTSQTLDMGGEGRYPAPLPLPVAP